MDFIMGMSLHHGIHHGYNNVITPWDSSWVVVFVYLLLLFIFRIVTDIHQINTYFNGV